MESWFVRVFRGEEAPEFASGKKRRSGYFLRTLQGRKVSRATPGREEVALVIKGESLEEAGVEEEVAGLGSKGEG